MMLATIEVMVVRKDDGEWEEDKQNKYIDGHSCSSLPSHMHIRILAYIVEGTMYVWQIS